MAIYKIIWMIVIFFGMTYMWWWSIGADYYDAEYYAQEAAKKISISAETLTTWCNLTGENLSGENLSWINNCPETTK
jgi:hypothetical protein